MQHDRQLAAVGGAELGNGLQVFVLFPVFLLQLAVFLDQFVLFQGEGDGQAQVIVVPGLENETVDGAVLDGTHDRVGIGVPGQHDADGLGPVLPHRAQQFAAIHARHHEVGHEQLHRLLLQDLQGLGGIAGKQQLIVFPLEHPLQCRQDIGLVVHQQQPVGLAPVRV